MNSTSKLHLAWCSYRAAKYAVEHWHYSGCMPLFKLVRVGVWEKGIFVGCVLFGGGACPQIGAPYNLPRTAVCELVRVALTKHDTPVSRIVSLALRLLRQASPLLRLVVSYADPEQGHVGGIYQAGNWLYSGPTKPIEGFEYTATGQRVHTKTIATGRRGYAASLKRRGVIRSIRTWKHKYLMPLDKAMAQQIEPLRQRYPKRARSDTSDTPVNQTGEGGAAPTLALSHT